jgi:glycosyltransferase involved in cell wall biosynthesis
MPAVRVLLVLATSAGGVGRHVAELAAGLAQDPGFDVLVAGPVMPSAGGGPGSEPWLFRFETVDIADRPRPLADLRAVARLRSLMRPLGAGGVVHAHGLRAGALAGLASRLIGRQRRPAVVATLHNALVSGGPIAVVHRMLERIVARTAGVVLVVSDDIGAAMRARGAQDVRPAIVPAPPLPAPGKTVAQTRAEIGIRDGAALVVTVARLAPQKGLSTLVDAATLLTSQLTGTPGMLAVIAGDGPLHDTLTAQIRAAGAPARLLGRIDRAEDIAALIDAADLVVVPSLWEGQPLVVQEALRAGAAVVATDAGGTAALAAGGAVLVPPADPDALADAIAGLLMDPVAIARLRERAAARGRELPGAIDALRAVSHIYRSVTRSG